MATKRSTRKKSTKKTSSRKARKRSISASPSIGGTVERPPKTGPGSTEDDPKGGEKPKELFPGDDFPKGGEK